MQPIRRTNRGFTLVEILIVVIILGILAAIVIPQFTNASQDARKSSVTSQLQTIRSQVELYKLQHKDQYPLVDPNAPTTSEWDWDKLTVKTNADGSTTGTPSFGPYLQSKPVNALTSGTKMKMNDTDTAAKGLQAPGTGAADTVFGFSFSRATGKIWAYDGSGNMHGEN